MSKKSFKTIEKNHSNARNTVGGIVNAKKSLRKEEAKLVDFVGYSVLHPKLTFQEQFEFMQEKKFPCVSYKVLTKLTEDYLSLYLKERREKGEYDVDGIVVYDSSKKYLNKETNPKHGFAYKMVMEDQQSEANVTEVKWDLSKNGLYKPVVHIEPIKVSGVIIKKATAHNGKFVFDNKIGPGAKILITRRGDVIPYIEKVIKPAKNNKPQMPESFKWNKTEVDIMVDEKNKTVDDINSINVKIMAHFFKTLDIKNISNATIEKIADQGYNTIIKLLNAPKSKLKAIDGLGERSVDKIHENIQGCFSNLKMEELMDASCEFGIGFGTRKSKALLETYPDLLKMNLGKKEFIEKIKEVDGFADKTAEQFVTNLPKYIKFHDKILNLKNFKVNIVMPSSKVKDTSINKKSANLFEGEKVVLTGIRDGNVTSFIEENGGKMMTAVSGNTTLVIYVKGDKTQGKLQKAIDLGVKVITFEEFIKKYKITPEK